MDPVAVVTVVIAVLAVGALLFLRSRSKRGGVVSSKPRSKSGRVLGTALREAWSGGINAGTWASMEEALIAADVGVGTAAEIVESVRQEHPGTPDQARSVLAKKLLDSLLEVDRRLSLVNRPSVVLVTGVNGSGKTTTIAKLAAQLVSEGSNVLLAGADTFRAAAGEQLKSWGHRIGVDVVGGQQGGDPASVVFDALQSAKSKEVDVVIVDTAGRLHGKTNLMAELAKIYRVASSNGVIGDSLLVLDATGGQNGLAQVAEFTKAIPVTGIVLTKLDGTAKGGIVVAVERELGVPVKFVGLGEGIDDLEPFVPAEYIADLLERS